MLKEISFDGNKTLLKKSEKVNKFYIIKSGGALLKGKKDTSIFMTNDIIDPISLITGKSSGDVSTVGKTSLFTGTEEDIFNLLKSKPRYFKNMIVKTIQNLIGEIEKPVSKKTTTNEIKSFLIKKKQILINEYQPLLFGEKSLYRKGVKFIERKDYQGSKEVLEYFLQNFPNSPLARPARLYLALAEIFLQDINKASEIMITLLERDDDCVAKYVRQMFEIFGFRIAKFQITDYPEIYPDDFYFNIEEFFGPYRKIVKKSKIFSEEGGKPEGIIVLTKGKIDILKTVNKKSFFIKSLNNQATFGELHNIGSCSYDVSIMIEQNSKIYVIPTEEFLKFITLNHPEYGIFLLKKTLLFQKILNEK